MGKKQHYIPRLNLAGFVDPTSGMLWVYEKGKPARESKPENTGFENYFYAYTNAQQQRDVEFLEKAFGKKESDAAVVFEKIKGFKSIYSSDREPFADFVALQIVRVPSFRTFTNKLAGKVFKDQIKQIAFNPVEFENFVAKMEEAAGKKTPGSGRDATVSAFRQKRNNPEKPKSTS